MREFGFEPTALLGFFRSQGYELHILTRAATRLAPNDQAIEVAAKRTGYVDLLCSREVLAGD